MVEEYSKIYKYDSKGKLRVWFMERDGGKYRTNAGIEGGKLVVSKWTTAEPTNVGRSNERGSVEQAKFEVEAAYEHKLSREYSKTPEDAKKGPSFIKPMLAQKYKKFQGGYFQTKLDGIRCVADVDELASRQGKPIIACPHIESDLKLLMDVYPHEHVFDGELYNHELKDDFNTIVSVVRKKKPTEKDIQVSREKIQYHIYDIVDTTLDFSDRYAVLLDIEVQLQELGIESIVIHKATEVSSEETFNELHSKALVDGYEGSMLRLDKPYEQKRSKNLLKYKEFQDAEFEVVRIEEGSGNWGGMAKRVVCKLPDGREFGSGIKGSQERAKELLHEEHKVVTVEFFEYTADGVPRFPVAVKFWGKERTL